MVPPNAGHLTSAAWSMPGRCVSIPNSGVPLTILGVSTPCIGWPMMRNASAGFSGTVARSGTGMPAASRASAA
jgi:hypothetical protein